MAQSYESVVSVAGGLLSGTAQSAGAPIFYTLDTGESTSKYGPQRLGPISAAQLSQIRTQPFGTVNGVPVSILEVAGQAITVPSSDVASLIAAIPSGITQVNNNISTSVRLATAPAPTPTPVTVRATAPSPLPNPSTIPSPSPPVITAPKTTTDPSNPLPLGNDIDNILDPNLTPEQIASLSPDDQQFRKNLLIQEAGGTPNTEGLGQDLPGNTIAVTAPKEGVEDRIDWRVRLQLAPKSTYFYKNEAAGILEPLFRTNGVIFPYTPAININYVANYEPASIVHNNYKVFQYSNSFIDSVQITCEFTAQDDSEAKYVLAVIHFFRSLTKMFFGQDQKPKAGTPPPLCYLTGMGTYQFAEHPLAVSSFAYNLPNDVDYISAAAPAPVQAPTARNNLSSSPRLPTNVGTGGVPAPPMFEDRPRANGLTWVPTKIQMVITCIPMMSRNEVSNEFSLGKYSTGSLISRGFW